MAYIKWFSSTSKFLGIVFFSAELSEGYDVVRWGHDEVLYFGEESGWEILQARKFEEAVRGLIE